MLNTRTLDNHWDDKISDKPWIAPGLQPNYHNYNYNDSGLGFVVGGKFEEEL